MSRLRLLTWSATLCVAASLSMAAPQFASGAESTDGGCSHTPSTARPVLSFGQSGSAVMQAQCLSNRWGGVPPKLTVDGVFDLRLRDKIRWIQGCHGLPASGVIDPSTWRVLYHPALDCYDPYPG
ncbi:peptidoglycan-binding domain-containing protein [Streptomyces sp. NPDC002346]